MTIEYLKTSLSAEVRSVDDRNVRQAVEKILKDVEDNGDEAVRRYSQQFDNYNPASFRLSGDDIERAIKRLSSRELDDIKFAQAQVRKFAEAQRASMTDVQIETEPGV